VSAELEGALALLTELAVTDVDHPSGTLAEHLQGTYDVLARWDCPQHLCMAGLYHSIYGTETFLIQTVPREARERVRAAAGEKAETLAYLYGVMRRSSLFANLERGGPYSVTTMDGTVIPLDGLEQFAELMTLDLANRVEQLRVYTSGSKELEDQRRIYLRAVPLLPQLAVRELASFPRRRPLEVWIRWLVHGLLRSTRLRRG